MTESERDIVLNRLDEYPAGVPPESWGYGPMEDADPAECSREELLEYG